MSNSSSSETKYQTLTPVPPIPPLSNPANYASPQSSGHYPSAWSNNSYSNGPGYSSFVQSPQYTGQQAPHSIGYMPNSVSVITICWCIKHKCVPVCVRVFVCNQQKKFNIDETKKRNLPLLFKLGSFSFFHLHFCRSFCSLNLFSHFFYH